MNAWTNIVLITYAGCLAITVLVHASISDETFQPELIEDTNEGSEFRDKSMELSEDLMYELEQEVLGLRRLGRMPSEDAQDLALPRQFDAREKWKSCAELMETIWDQGNCRSSSVVAVASMASDRLCISTNGSFRSSLSAQYLMACSSSCDANELISTPLEYLKKEGAPTGGPYNSAQTGCVPFDVKPCDHSEVLGKFSLEPCNYTNEFVSFSCPDNCTNSAYPKSLTNDTHTMKHIYEIDEYEERKMKKEIFNNGPIVAGFVLFEDFLKYQNGVYRHMGYGPYIRIQSVKLIGWGVEKRVPYWLGVNSFGENWGTKGLFKFYRGRNHLYIETMVAAGRF